LAAAPIAAEVFRSAGFSAEIRPTSVLVASPPYKALIDRLGRAPTDAEAQAAQAPCIVIGAQRQPASHGGWPGHLIALVGGTLLVDLSAYQLSEPSIGFSAPLSVVTLVDEDWLAARSSSSVEFDGAWHMYFRYQKRLEGTWTSGSMWLNTEKRSEVLKEILRLL
jgi:hypothetical protein